MRTWRLFAHKQSSSFFYCTNKGVCTISFFTSIKISANTFAKERSVVVCKNYSLIQKPLLNDRIWIKDIRVWSFVKAFCLSWVSKISRPCCSSLFKRRIVREWGQLFGGPFSIVERKPSIPYSSKINLGDRHSWSRISRSGRRRGNRSRSGS